MMMSMSDFTVSVRLLAIVKIFHHKNETIPSLFAKSFEAFLLINST